MCLSRKKQLGRERFARELGASLDLLAEHLHAHDQVPHELPFVGVGEGVVVRQLVDLADVVQEDARQEQVAVDFGVEVGDPVGHVQERDDVLEQPSLIRMVVLDSRRGRRELADEVIVDQEALDQGAEVRVAHRQQDLAQPCQQLGDVLRALRQKLVGLDLLYGGSLRGG